MSEEQIRRANHMKRHYANPVGLSYELPSRQACPGGGVRPSRPTVARKPVQRCPADEFEDAFAELLAYEPPGGQGLVLAY